MDSTDQVQLLQRVRVSYELGRAKRALWGALPVLVVGAIAASFTHRPASTAWFGAAAFGLGALFLWYGRDAQRAVLLGLSAGLPPLALALCANGMHHCSGVGCTTWCVPACTLGGVLAGLAVSSVANARRASLMFWLSASALTLSTGAMGCACVGYMGVIGLSVGYAAGMLPGLLRQVLSDAPR
jgi:hypothetical protein